jgi:hypothetical protein
MADINCNSVSNFGIGINFDGHCDDTELRQNTLTDFDIGININNSKIARSRRSKPEFLLTKPHGIISGL